MEEVLVELYEACMGEQGIEVNALEERVNLDRGLGGGGEVRRRRRVRAFEKRAADRN